MASRPTLSVVKDAERRGAEQGGLSLREHCEKTAKSIMQSRTAADPICAEIASLAQPARSPFCPPLGGRRARAQKLINNLHDGHGVYAARILKNGMTSGLSQPSRPWFKLKVPDTDLMEFYATKVWLDAVQKVIYDFFSSTNFYAASEAGYGELGLFGTEACFMGEHWRKGMVAFPMVFGEYWLATDDSGSPDQMLRSVPLTVRQMVERFVSDSFDSQVLDWSRVSPSIKTAWDNSDYGHVIDCLHLVEPNPRWDPSRFDDAGKPWRSIYWEAGRDLQVTLEASGNEEQPFWAARWDTASGYDPYGTGPGWNALADLRGLQTQARRKGQATDYVVRPPMVGPAGAKLNLNPGSYTRLAGVDSKSVFPAWAVDYRTVEVLRADVTEIRQAVDRHFFVDLFLAITGMDGVQPRNEQEIFSRESEKLTQLGPVIDRVNVEKLGVAIDYLERQGFPAKAIRDPAARDAMRAKRAQEAAAEQARQSAPAMADGAKAAELLSRTDLRGQPLLDQIAGNYGR
jgi:hypothetical protein